MSTFDNINDVWGIPQNVEQSPGPDDCDKSFSHLSECPLCYDKMSQIFQQSGVSPQRNDTWKSNEIICVIGLGVVIVICYLIYQRNITNVRPYSSPMPFHPNVHPPVPYYYPTQMLQMPQMPQMPSMQMPQMPSMQMPQMPSMQMPQMPSMQMPQMPQVQIPQGGPPFRYT